MLGREFPSFFQCPPFQAEFDFDSSDELTAPSAPSPTEGDDLPIGISKDATPTLMYTPVTAEGAEVESEAPLKFYITPSEDDNTDEG